MKGFMVHNFYVMSLNLLLFVYDSIILLQLFITIPLKEFSYNLGVFVVDFNLVWFWMKRQPN